jgi:hypothetical protein
MCITCVVMLHKANAQGTIAAARCTKFDVRMEVEN